MAYIARRTRDKAAFLAPLTPCGQQKGAKRQFSPFFADFDQKTQKLHQNKPGIGIAHRFYIEKGITGVISGEVFFYRPPLIVDSRTSNIFHGCFGGGNSCGIYLWWVLWISIYRTRRSSSLLALGCGGVCICVETYNICGEY